MWSTSSTEMIPLYAHTLSGLTGLLRDVAQFCCGSAAETCGLATSHLSAGHCIPLFNLCLIRLPVVEVPVEPGSAPRLADVRVRVPAAAAPAPPVAEERVRIAIRDRPPEVIDDEEQSPRCDVATTSVH